MKLFNSKKTVASEPKAGGGCQLPFRSLRQKMSNGLNMLKEQGVFNKLKMFKIQNIFNKENIINKYSLSVVFIVALIVFLVNCISRVRDDSTLEKQQVALLEEIQKRTEDVTESEDIETIVSESSLNEAVPTMLPEYEALYAQNEDFVGWLRIDDTAINYPVMQHLEDENYYLNRDFYGEQNKNGSLIMDNDSNVGVGTLEQDYANGSKPSSNLIIHGHNMKSGKMFGKLMQYEDEEYGKSHNTIYFDSCYEKREYELIAVFYSQVFYQSQDVFKFYKFFQADTREEFDDWYNNIKEMSIYDTGVTAQFGDEFITLTCCAYHVEDGRFVVVGRRIN